MPDFIATAPDGRKFKITAPEGATPDQMRAYAEQNMAKLAPAGGQGGASSAPDQGGGLMAGLQHAGGMAAAAGKGFLGGIGDTALGIEQMAGKGLEALGAKGLGRTLAKRADKGIERLDKETASPNYPVSSGVGQVAGAVAFPGPKNPIAAGLVNAAIQPVKSGDFWKEKEKQAVIGGALGAAAHGVGSALAARGAAKAAKGLDPEKQMLLDEGVRMSPGQLGSENANRTEQKLASKPGLGPAIAAARQRAMNDYQRATVNKVLGPIKQKIPQNITDPHEMVEYSAQKVSDAYKAILPHMAFKPDMQMANAVQRIIKSNATLPPIIRGQFNEFIQKEMQEPLAQKGFLTGQEMNHLDSVIGQRAKMYTQSLDPDQKRFGMALRELQEEFRDNISRANPVLAPQLADIRKAFAMQARVEAAAGRRATSLGNFTPGDLLGAIKAADGSARRKAFAHGDSLLQPWARAGQRHLGSTVPNSGTADRLQQWDTIPKVAGALTAGVAYHGLDALTSAAAKHPGAVSGSVGRGINRIATPLTKALTGGQ